MFHQGYASGRTLFFMIMDYEKYIERRLEMISRAEQIKLALKELTERAKE